MPGLAFHNHFDQGCALTRPERVGQQSDRILAVASELMSPTCIHHVPGGQLAPGLASLRDWLCRTHRIFPDFHAIVEDGFAAGDHVARRITAYAPLEFRAQARLRRR